MLERIVIRNFKRFEEVEIELGQHVLFVGPNNAGKTSALQALALWELGVRRWHERRGKGSSAKKRRGVVINRRDILSAPVPECRLLWRDLRVRVSGSEAGRQTTSNVRMEIIVSGVTAETSWECGLEFDFANAESIYCRPIGSRDNGIPVEIPKEALSVKVAFLHPMSGLAASEVRLDPGAIQVRLGEGRTAEVLRNLCWVLHESSDLPTGWEELREQIAQLFAIELEAPEYIAERGEISMGYQERGRAGLDLSSAGRGMQQTLLLLAYLYTNPGAVVLLDEPDAHLEVLRQRQVYEVLTEAARKSGSQVIAASHSEVLLNEAADRDVVVAFVGKPHRIDDRGSQVLKALKSIGFEYYHQAEQTGWVLYLEGATDLAILRAFAESLEHSARAALERPFVHYIGNQLSKASEQFHGLRVAVPNLAGIAILDHQDQLPETDDELLARCWSRREIENYLCVPEVLEAYASEQATGSTAGPLFAAPDVLARVELMRDCVRDQVPPAALRDRSHEWWRNVKASDEFLNPVFETYFQNLGLRNLMQKSDYHGLARLVVPEAIDSEIVDVLDVIWRIAEGASPNVDGST